MVRQKSPACALDFGCWDGHFLPSLLNHFPEVWGVDDDSASAVEMLPDSWTILQTARHLCNSEFDSAMRLGLTKATGAALPFGDRYFDVVFCLDTLAHVRATVRPTVVDELRRITKTGGQVIFSLPVEIGPIRLLREAARSLTGRLSDPNLKGYDFRSDLKLLHSSFAVAKRRFVPLNIMGSLNPFVLVDCRTVSRD